jgi:hypothetical protein
MRPQPALGDHVEVIVEAFDDPCELQGRGPD